MIAKNASKSTFGGPKRPFWRGRLYKSTSLHPSEFDTWDFRYYKNCLKCALLVHPGGHFSSGFASPKKKAELEPAGTKMCTEKGVGLKLTISGVSRGLISVLGSNGFQGRN